MILLILCLPVIYREPILQVALNFNLILSFENYIKYEHASYWNYSMMWQNWVEEEEGKEL